MIVGNQVECPSLSYVDRLKRPGLGVFHIQALADRLSFAKPVRHLFIGHPTVDIGLSGSYDGNFPVGRRNAFNTPAGCSRQAGCQ